MCHQGSIVSKEGLSDGDVHDPGFGSEFSQVEQSAVRSIMQVDSIFTLAEGAGQEHQEEDPKECEGEHTALLDSTIDGEWV